MNIGFFINDVRTELVEYATTTLALAAARRGHRVWYIGMEDLAFDPNDTVCARARTLPKKKYKNNHQVLEELQANNATVERICVLDMDVLLLRNNPYDDESERPWVQSAGVLFGQLAARSGVLVLNDPSSLANALNKLYFQFFPEEVRPSSLITRDRAEIRSFVESHPKEPSSNPCRDPAGRTCF